MAINVTHGLLRRALVAQLAWGDFRRERAAAARCSVSPA